MRSRNKNGDIIFSDYPEFTPNLTPAEIFQLGSFGGTYWRRIHSVRTYQYKKYPKSWFDGLDPAEYLTRTDYNSTINKYKVKVGTSLEYWESKGWITRYDPYGWVQWYCNFYLGRRCPDDERQIKRWQGIAGPTGRFRKRLINLGGKDDESVSPKIRQTLQHWAYRVV
jgi:hypothetical protein